MSRSLLVPLLVIGVVAVLGASFLPSHSSALLENNGSAASGAPVLVELFTSEGCSSCPPADKLLGELDKAGSLDGVPVIALGEHVDYWDGLGWKDRFSSRQFTDRQRQFVDRLRLDSAYTPQMVVDGHLEFVGNDERALRQALAKASHSAKPAQVKLSWDGDHLKIAVTDTGVHAAKVLLAITETNLATEVQRGENGGRTLHHAAVVRKLSQIGDLRNSQFTSSIAVTRDASWNPENLKLVVFVQDEKTGTVLGASAIPIPKQT